MLSRLSVRLSVLSRRERGERQQQEPHPVRSASKERRERRRLCQSLKQNHHSLAQWIDLDRSLSLRMRTQRARSRVLFRSLCALVGWLLSFFLFFFFLFRAFRSSAHSRALPLFLLRNIIYGYLTANGSVSTPLSVYYYSPYSLYISTMRSSESKNIIATAHEERFSGYTVYP